VFNIYLALLKTFFFLFKYLKEYIMSLKQHQPMCYPPYYFKLTCLIYILSSFKNFTINSFYTHEIDHSNVPKTTYSLVQAKHTIQLLLKRAYKHYP